ncbi:hypothetical protein CY35_13G055700 [Sphagnum magellanicum]|nr:hypothetical protein CY35_13G055700 [Sphagnum magellanicum]
MLGALHARRLYEDSKIEEQKRQGKELEFAPDWKATFLQVLPLRFISRVWGSVTSLELPLWARHYVYKGWARAFNSNLEEMSRPLEDYTSLREFFTRELKEGVRPLALGPACLLSPVDGIMIRCGEVRGSGTMIEQVKGFSYSVSALLGATPPPLALAFSESETSEQNGEKIKPDVPGKPGKRRWSSLWSTTKTLQPVISDRSAKGLFYCVLYLGPGDYHRIHSPSDWQIYHRRHFAGKLYPVNNRAVRTIKNLYVVNERVVLEGKWSQGLMAMAAVGATNVGSIELKFEPELKTNVPIFGKDVQSVVNTCTYGEKGEGLTVKGGDEVAIFNLGSTVVLVFQAPASCVEDDPSQKPVEGFTFIVQNGERVKVGQALGQW